jgi:hypothetical protein
MLDMMMRGFFFCEFFFVKTKDRKGNKVAKEEVTLIF